MTVMGLDHRIGEAGAPSTHEAVPAIAWLDAGARGAIGAWLPGLAGVLQGSADRLMLAQAGPLGSPVPPDGAGQAAADDAPPLGAAGASLLGTALPQPANVLVPGTHGTSAEAAAGILQEVAAGRPPFRPELGTKGPVTWFVTEGNPHIGGTTPPEVIIPAEVAVPPGTPVLEFREADLQRIKNGFMDEAREVVRLQYAEQYPNRSLTSRGSVGDIEFRASQLADRMTWTEVGNRVAASEGGIGRVIMEQGSDFSRQGAGTFTLTSRPELAQVRGGPQALVDVIKRSGVPAEQGVIEAAEALARQGRIAGQIEGVFRVGGRVMIVAGLAADGYRIYTADDQLREAVRVGGGWAGAAGAVAAYNAWAAPSNVAGPWAWAGNALVSVGVGAAGYFAGEAAAGAAYDLVVDPDPITVPAQ